jgi:hypothetical protein
LPGLASFNAISPVGDPEIAPLTAFGVIEELSMIALP